MVNNPFVFVVYNNEVIVLILIARSISSKHEDSRTCIYSTAFMFTPPLPPYSNRTNRSLVLPQLTYCSSVWSPPPFSYSSQNLERIKHFALKLCSRQWSSDYSFQILLSTLQLSSRHARAKLLPFSKPRMV